MEWDLGGKIFQVNEKERASFSRLEYISYSVTFYSQELMLHLKLGHTAQAEGEVKRSRGENREWGNDRGPYYEPRAISVTK